MCGIAGVIAPSREMVQAALSVMVCAQKHRGPDDSGEAVVPMGSLLLARDALGIKPLYVAITPDAFLFASEVRAILASGLVQQQIDRRAIAGFLAYGAVPEPFTLIEGVREFPAGCYSEVKGQRSEV